MSELRQLALEIARCGNVAEARNAGGHPCKKIVSVQSGGSGNVHVPEAWAGALDSARVLYISSNPAIGDVLEGEDQGTAELYPREADDDSFIEKFIVDRFTADPAYASKDGSFLQVNGLRSKKKVSFWVNIRNRSIELMGADADPAHSYAMTEVVHCKSRKDNMGVKEARTVCADLYLERIISHSPASVLVVVGAQARDALKSRWSLPGAFGAMTKATPELGSVVASETESIVQRTIAGVDRVVVFLPHPNSQGTKKTFADNYPNSLIDLQKAAAPRGSVGTAVVVAARVAYGEYLEHGAYVCQPNRRFRADTTHLSFYSEQQIQPHIAEIEAIYDDVSFTYAEAAQRAASEDEMERRLGLVIASFLNAGVREEGARHEVILLSQANDFATLELTAPVVNDLTNAEGRRIAFTQGHRYVDLEVLTGGISATSKIARLRPLYDDAEEL